MAAEEESGQSSPHEVRERVRGESNVLFLVPAMSDIGPDACLDCFVGDDVGGSRVLAVSYTRPADALLESWRSRLEDAPGAITVVTVGETTRSATASAETTETRGPVTVTSLESPDDLTGLGIAIGQQLSEWEGQDGPTYLCFDSLTVLLQYAELQRAFRFLHVLSGRVAGFDAYAHYHLDPTAVDDRAVATIASLFDAVVQYRDGTWKIRGQ